MNKISLQGLFSPDGKSSTGLSENIAGLLCYVLGPYTWIMGLIFFFMEKNSKFVKFHAVQAIILGAAFFVVWLVFIILAGVLFFLGAWWVFALLGWLLWLAGAAVCIIAIIQTYNKKDFVLPIIGEQAYNIATK